MNQKSTELNHQKHNKENNKNIVQEILKLEEKITLKKNILFNKQEKMNKEIDKVYMRTRKDIEKAYKFSLEKKIILLLPIIDNLERALALSNTNINDTNIKIIKQLKLTIKNFLKILDDFSVTVINTVNVLFNPDIHQAMSIQYSDTIKENHVINILQNGYLLNDRLLRPAMVSVAKNNNHG